MFLFCQFCYLSLFGVRLFPWLVGGEKTPGGGAGEGGAGVRGGEEEEGGGEGEEEGGQGQGRGRIHEKQVIACFKGTIQSQ
jgi:hypothetical protein